MTQSNPKGLILEVRLSPGAKRNQILGYYGEKQIKIAIKSPPVDGKANAALVKFLAESFSLSQKNVELISGETSRSKRILLKGDPLLLKALLEKIISHA